MTEPDERSTAAAEAEFPPRRRKRKLLLVAGLLLALVSAGLWISREMLADRLIADMLGDLGLEATYQIESISPRRVVLTDIVVGDPRQPDLTVARAEIEAGLRLFRPQITRVSVTRARVFGSYRGGRLSFGALDPLLFPQDQAEPFRLPPLVLVLGDARGLLETDYGPVAFKAAGQGNLRGGFAGIIAVAAPKLVLDQCAAQQVTVYGTVRIAGERPEFDGPLRIGGGDCLAGKLALRRSALALKLRVDQDFSGLEGAFDLSSAGLIAAAGGFGKAGGTGRFGWHEQRLTADYALSFSDAEVPQLQAGTITADGAVRALGGFTRIEAEARIAGAGVRLGPDADQTLAGLAGGMQDSLAGPVLRQIREALRREGRSSALLADIVMRRAEGRSSMVIPSATLRGTSGEVLLSLSRFQLGQSDGVPHLSGNFATGGRGLPRIAGSVAARAGGVSTMNLALAEYSAGGNRIALPRFSMTRLADGSLRFSGSARLSGSLPGGFVKGLDVPLSGRWSAAGGLSMWDRCTTLRFDTLAYAQLELDRHVLTLCPAPGRAILAANGRGTSFAAGTIGLALSGRLAETPIAVTASSAGFAWPGVASITGLDMRLGGEGEQSAAHFILPELTARFDSQTGGTFQGLEARLAAVPLDISQGAGQWSYQGDALYLTQTGFTLEDREQVDRFQPLIARDATLALTGGVIEAEAVLREPTSGRAITLAKIRHDLASGAGGADLVVDNLVFDQQLQPEMISPLMLGVVANSFGTIAGQGRLDWSGESVTSNGTFSSDGLDFAAAFGPVEGLSGTIVFSDLLGMVSAPDQSVRIASMNPGIEVGEGVISYQLLAGFQLRINHGEWPFLGGTLVLHPAEIAMGEGAVRRLTLELRGMDAARFIERMEMANLAATGLFDGTIPLMFNQDGGFIEKGRLTARPPGGNLSYIGELTYADLPVVAHYAFESLKSLDYTTMEIGMDGSLGGEIVTRVRFDGIRQGTDASHNIITRQIAKLPIRFNVNIRAPFYQLISSMRSLYDPAYLRDPRELGLIDAQGNAMNPPGVPNPVQTPESEAAP